jgi:hypothetical protein
MNSRSPSPSPLAQEPIVNLSPNTQTFTYQQYCKNNRRQPYVCVCDFCKHLYLQKKHNQEEKRKQILLNRQKQEMANRFNGKPTYLEKLTSSASSTSKRIKYFLPI